MFNASARCVQKSLNGFENFLTPMFFEFRTELIEEELSLIEKASDALKAQHDANTILDEIKDYAEKCAQFDHVLGIIDVDIFVPRLNFIFGVAEHPEKASLISLWRPRPEFYGQSAQEGTPFGKRCEKSNP